MLLRMCLYLDDLEIQCLYTMLYSLIAFSSVVSSVCQITAVECHFLDSASCISKIILIL